MSSLRSCRYRPTTSPKCVILVFLITIATLELTLQLHTFLKVNLENCHLTNEEIQDLRLMLKSTTNVLEEMNVTYWLDYGTLLGAVRNGDVMRRDYDADISIIATQYEELKEKLKQVRLSLTHTENNGFDRVRRADRDQNLHVDIFSWDVIEGLCDQKPCKKVARTQDDFMGIEIAVKEYETIPLSWILPQRKIDFADFKVKIPNRAGDVLKNRYPVTYRWTISYKIKCWLPW
ncbi:ribitol 5-phosphate transferase FKRP-like [Glandiceps talaboti]